MLQQILSRDNMERAYKRVTTNKGAAGVDGVETIQLCEVLNEQWPRIKTEILEGRCKPQPVRRVEIDKPGGGTRPLVIPTTTDRLIQQAIQQVLGPVYEPEFSPYSYGFRPGKSAHDGVRQALSYINEGYRWVVDMDLKSFSGKVNHDYLMHLVSQRIYDKPLLKLIRRYLQAGVMCGGVVSPNRQGTPQGGPLSPLLSNILLDVLDTELESRGHRFVRYADDCSIYVASQRAGYQVLASITRFIEEELKLEVNQCKSGVRKARNMELLGYSFYPASGGYRLRYCIWTQWKRVRTRYKALRKLGAGHRNAYGV